MDSITVLVRLVLFAVAVATFVGILLTIGVVTGDRR